MKNHSTSQEDDQNPEKKRRDNHMEEVKGIGYLPRDLIIEILSRLPPKVICKIRCVSKSWNTLLTSDKVFLARQIEWSKQEPLLLIRRYIDGIGEPNSSKITIELTSIDMQGEVTDIFREVMDRPLHTFVSCGPLSILCCMYTLYVCNPSIHQVVRVPYHSNSRLYYIGFGYIPLSNEYKIVHLFCHSSVGNGKMGCEIFSFKAGEGVASDSWRKIEDCPFSAWTEDYPVCVNGVIYWSLSSDLNDKTILSLDLEKEEFSRISYPIFSSEKYTFLEYTGLMGALCVVGFSPEASMMDIWMLKDNKNKIWETEYSINLFPYCPRFLIHSDCNSEEILVHMEGDIFCYGLVMAYRIELQEELEHVLKSTLHVLMKIFTELVLLEGISGQYFQSIWRRKTLALSGLFVIGCSVETSTMDVWFWDKHENNWLIKHCISIFPFVVNFVVPSDNESEDIVIHMEQKGLIRYDIKND